MWVPEPCEAHTAKVSVETNARLEVADILRRFGPSYAQTHSVSPVEQRLMDDLIACRTAQLGGHLDTCTQCGFERPAYNSCLMGRVQLWGTSPIILRNQFSFQ